QLYHHRREQWKLSLDLTINDDSFETLRPTLLSWNDYKDDCKLIIDEGKYHSDEVSETDEELANEEIAENI
ncbi:7516_t:CDS:2, partial [Funneliformis caledonium]